MASGTEPHRMMNGSRKLLNCAASTRKMSTSARMKRRQELVALRAQLARFAVLIERVALRAGSPGALVLQER
jgi:hypothetical protein